MADKIDARFRGFVIEVGVDRLEVFQVDEATVAVIGGKVEMCEKIGADDWLFDVSNYEVKWVILATQCYSMSDATITGYCGAIGGREFGPIRTVFSLGWEWREDREEGSSVDEPFDFGSWILHV